MSYLPASAFQPHDATGLFLVVAVIGVALVAVALRRSRSRPGSSGLSSQPPTGTTPTGTSGVTVIDPAALSRMTETLLGRGSMQKMVLKEMLDPNSRFIKDIATLHSSEIPRADTPFAAILQVKAALREQRLDNVRPLISESLYQRWSVSPPVPAVQSLQADSSHLLMATLQKPGSDPNHIVVRVADSVGGPSAPAEEWTLVRGVQAALPPPAQSPSACPYCGAQLDTGATRCRYCGMDVTVAMPSPMQSVGSDSGGWIVEDVTPASPMAA